ncbi:MAG: rod shape-determining protein [Clostridiales bacterium]|jgi:rod shape-determining protein MreB|nr:rod shape-determining protein [Clostridiales bacterium]
MAVMHIAIDLGTSYVTVYAAGSGIVLKEPSIVAFSGEEDGRRIKAFGQRAAEMVGRTPDRTLLVSPVTDGYIQNYEVAAVLIKECVKCILPESYIFLPKIKALVAVPTGLSVDERKAYEDAFVRGGVNEVTMVDNIMATAVGYDLPVSLPAGGMLVNIGGGSTEVALVSMCGIIAGCSVNVGGQMMDKALMDFITGKYGLKAGVSSVRKLKHDVASLYPNDISSGEIKGVNIKNLTPASVTVYASDIYETLLPYYTRICEAVAGIINVCPPELASDILEMGIYVAGGGASVPGLSEFFSELLGMRITVAENAELIPILGAGKLLANIPLLKEINGA